MACKTQKEGHELCALFCGRNHYGEKSNRGCTEWPSNNPDPVCSRYLFHSLPCQAIRERKTYMNSAATVQLVPSVKVLGTGHWSVYPHWARLYVLLHLFCLQSLLSQQKNFQDAVNWVPSSKQATYCASKWSFRKGRVLMVVDMTKMKAKR